MTSSIKYNSVFKSLGHECEMLADEDILQQTYQGNSLGAKLKRFWMKLVIVDEKICKVSLAHLRSHGAILKEQRRQLQQHPFSIHPFSRMRTMWEITIVFIWLALLILVPLDLAFFFFWLKTAPFITSTPFVAVRFFLDLCLVIDLIVNSFTGYYDESTKEIILSIPKIVKHNLSMKFVLDLLTAIPTHIDLFMDFQASREMHTAYLYLQFISMLKYMKIFALNRYAVKIFNLHNVNFYFRHCFLTAVIIVLYWHMLSCTQVFSHVIFDGSRISKAYMNTTFFVAWCRTLYEGAMIISTSSYGLHEPIHQYEYFVINCSWILSKFFQMYLLARVIQYFKAKTSPRIKYHEVVKQLVEFMRHRHLPRHTQKRILEYYEFHFQKTYFRESEIGAAISGQLRQEVVMHTCRQLVENVEFFRALPLNLLIKIVTCLKSEIYLSNDVIVKAGTRGDSMYFIASGNVAVYSSTGREVCHLEDGQYFGEVALVAENSMRVATVVAVETSELYKLNRDDFVRAVRPYPDLLEKVQKIAADRVEKTILADLRGDARSDSRQRRSSI